MSRMVSSPLLDAVGHRPFVEDVFRPKGVLDLLGACRQRHRHRHHPQHRQAMRQSQANMHAPITQCGADGGEQLGHIVENIWSRLSSRQS